MPFCTRSLLRQRAARSSRRRLRVRRRPRGGVPRLQDHRSERLQPEDAGQPGTPPEVELLTTGYQLLTEQRYDLHRPGGRAPAQRPREARPAAALVRGGVRPEPVRVHARARCPAWLRPTRWCCCSSAVKQIARRHGYHATFMCRPKLPNVMSSGWHLHQSLTRGGRNAFVRSEKEDLSEIGQAATSPGCSPTRAAPCAFSDADHQRLQALPPLLARARPRDLGQGEPRRAAARDRRRRATRRRGIENRIGEPAANPYLYFASQIYSRPRRHEPQAAAAAASADTPYEAKAELLPRTLAEALERLRRRQGAARRASAGTFVDYYCTHQGSRDRALQPRGERMGAPRILRSVLKSGQTTFSGRNNG